MLGLFNLRRLGRATGNKSDNYDPSDKSRRGQTFNIVALSHFFPLSSAKKLLFGATGDDSVGNPPTVDYAKFKNRSTPALPNRQQQKRAVKSPTIPRLTPRPRSKVTEVVVEPPKPSLSGEAPESLEYNWSQQRQTRTECPPPEPKPAPQGPSAQVGKWSPRQSLFRLP